MEESASFTGWCRYGTSRKAPGDTAVTGKAGGTLFWPDSSSYCSPPWYLPSFCIQCSLAPFSEVAVPFWESLLHAHKGQLKVLMPNISLSAAGMFAGFAGLFTGLKPWMILQTHSAVTCYSSYPVLLWMWCEFHVRKYNKPSQAVLSVSVYWFKWVFKTPRRQLHGSKETLRTNVKELGRNTKYQGSVKLNNPMAISSSPAAELSIKFHLCNYI